jgi:hypothetical protein
VSVLVRAAATITTPMELPMKRFALLAVALAGFLTLGATSLAASSLPTLTLALTKNTVTVGGSEVSGAVNVVTTVTGEASDDPGLVLLKPGVSVGQFANVVSHLGMNSPLDVIDPYGTIVFDGQAAKGQPSTAEVDLAPGTYVALENGNGHAVFTVTQSASPASLPAPGATVTAIDFGFRGANVLHDGELVRFENTGFLIHMFLFGKLRSAADAKPAEALLLKGKINEAGKKYAVLEGQFAGPLSTGAMQQEVITEPPGVYVILCEMNAQDGRPHFELGMFRTIRIVK